MTAVHASYIAAQQLARQRLALADLNWVAIDWVPKDGRLDPGISVTAQQSTAGSPAIVAPGPSA